ADRRAPRAARRQPHRPQAVPLRRRSRATQRRRLRLLRLDVLRAAPRRADGGVARLDRVHALRPRRARTLDHALRQRRALVHGHRRTPLRHQRDPPDRQPLGTPALVGRLHRPAPGGPV
ncbi:MAG: hypothetical protein AVDCRST_MAG38-1581, partial [uncultured Solirubrobacteraceae bacterium]